MAAQEFMKQENWYFIVPFIALLLSTTIYLLFIHSFQQYDSETVRFAHSLDLYTGIPPRSLLFFGESQVREDIDCLIIEKYLNNTCFNLGVAGMMPVPMALQKDLIIKAKPQRVVLGVTAAFFDETLNKNNDFFMVINGHTAITADAFMEKRILAEEQTLLSMNWFEKDLYKRKFILPFYLALLQQTISPPPTRPSSINNFKNPHLFIQSQPAAELARKLKDPKISSIFWFENSSKRQREAFTYLIRELAKARIDTVIIQMPLHPLVNEVVSNESQQIFGAYLQQLSGEFGLKVVNAENDFGEEYFTDLTHLNSQGEKLFSQKIARGEYPVIQ